MPDRPHRAFLQLLGCATCVALLACDGGQPSTVTVNEHSFWDDYEEVDGFDLISMDSIPLGQVTAATWLGDTLAVADGIGSTVRLYTNSGREVQRLGYPGNGPGELRSPEALAVDHSGTLWVGDYRARLLKRSNTVTGLETVNVVPPTIRSITVPFDDGRMLVSAVTRSGSQSYAATVIDANGQPLDHVFPIEPGTEPNRMNLQAFFTAESGGFVLLMDRSADTLGIWQRDGGNVVQVPIPRVLGYEPIEWPAEPIMDGRALADFMGSQWRGHVVTGLEDGRFLLSVINSDQQRRIQLLLDATTMEFQVYGDAPPLPFRTSRSDTLYWVGSDQETGRSHVRRFAPRDGAAHARPL